MYIIGELVGMLGWMLGALTDPFLWLLALALGFLLRGRWLLVAAACVPAALAYSWALTAMIGPVSPGMVLARLLDFWLLALVGSWWFARRARKDEIAEQAASFD